MSVMDNEGHDPQGFLNTPNYRSQPVASLRNARVQARYDALMAAGKHGHYETMFRLVREEVEAERERCAKIAETYFLNIEATKAAHYRQSPEPFKFKDFGFSRELWCWSQETAHRIRNADATETHKMGGGVA